MNFMRSPYCRRLAGLLLATAVLSACAPLRMQPTPPVTVSQLRFIGEQRLPLKMAFQGSVVGGLSGIDYDQARGDWVMVSDDRSERSPSRYYRARLDFDATAFKGVRLESVVTLRPMAAPILRKRRWPGGPASLPTSNRCGSTRETAASGIPAKAMSPWA
jgi:hypothetical protein